MAAEPRMDIAVEVSPLTVLVRGVLEWACPAALFEEVFDRVCRPRQWNRKLAISDIAWLLLMVTAGVRKSVFAAFRADRGSKAPRINASPAALYAKYSRIDPNFTAAVVSESGRRMQELLNAAGVTKVPGWERYRPIVLDGTDLAGTEHRLKVLRTIKAAGLPGRLVAAYDMATGVVTNVVASEDAYTSERELVCPILDGAKPGDLYVADRHFSTTEILFKIMDHEAFFVIRQHVSLRWRALEEPRAVGRVKTGEVSEQLIEVEDTSTGECRQMRRIILKLDKATDEGETGIYLLTNLRGVSALLCCDLYRGRWRIEQYFSLVKTVLHGEIPGLGRPRAALLAMGMTLIAANALSVVKHDLRQAHGQEEFEKLSGYYMADEVAANYRSVDALVPEAEWGALGNKPAEKFWDWSTAVASRVRIRALHKHPRGPKKPLPPRKSGKHRHHYSTYRLLKAEDT